MALLFADGFGAYATAEIPLLYSVTGAAVAINSTGGRRGGGSLYAPNNSNGNQYVLKNLGANYSTLICGFNFNPSTVNITTTSGVTRIAQFWDGGTVQMSLCLNADGTISVLRGTSTTNLLSTTSAVLTAGVDNYVEFKCTFHGTTGSYDLRFNGVTVASGSSVNTSASGNNYASSVSIGSHGLLLTGGVTWKWDDYYIADTSGSSPNNNFLGDVRIDPMATNADGTYLQWTPSTGTTHYTLVDDTTPNLTDYVSDGTVGNKDSFAMTDVPALTAQVIYGVVVRAAALKDDAGARSLKVGVRSGATDSLSAAQALSTAQSYYTHILTTDPNTSAAWTESGVNAMQTVVETA